MAVAQADTLFGPCRLLPEVGDVLPAKTVVKEDSGEGHNDNHEHGSNTGHGSISRSYRNCTRRRIAASPERATPTFGGVRLLPTARVAKTRGGAKGAALLDCHGQSGIAAKVKIV